MEDNTSEAGVLDVRFYVGPSSVLYMCPLTPDWEVVQVNKRSFAFTDQYPVLLDRCVCVWIHLSLCELSAMPQLFLCFIHIIRHKCLLL